VRLFVAVSPPERVLEAVRAVERPPVPALRWTTQEQWHVTLRFLGEVEAPEPVIEALGRVPEALADATAPVDVRATLGPRSAWFDGRQVLQVPVTGLDALARAVAEATAAWGDPAKDRPFRGHLTLARVRGRARGPAGVAGAPLAGAWRVDAFGLFTSVLGGGGSRYETLATVSLGDAVSTP
jgi:2'-5' RNA ligase